MEAERKRASDWYRWLWLSPLITIPTLVFVLFSEIGWRLVCRGPGSCDWRLAEQISLMLAILLSAAWHLVLLKPVSDKSLFVHWHGIQALCLAGLRTAVPLFFVIVYGFDIPSLVTIPILICIWLFGTPIAQQQAVQGKCGLAQLAGQGDEMARYQKPKTTGKLEPAKMGPDEVEEWMSVIRFSQDSEERYQALKELRLLDMVEDF